MVGHPFSGWVNRTADGRQELGYLSITRSDGFSRNPQNF